MVWSGRRHVMMGASQIDRRQPELRVHRFARAARAPSCSACAARPATRSTTGRRTGSRTTRRRVFVPEVDVVSGVGYDRAAELGRGRRASTRSCASSRTSRARLRDARPPDALAFGAPGRDRRRRGRRDRLRARDRRRRARVAAADRRRGAADPRGHRPERAGRARSPGSVTPAHAALRRVRRSTSRSCRPAWAGSRARGSSTATANAGALGILASATMTYDQLATRDPRGQGAHRPAVRREPARRRRGRRRARRAAHPRRRAGRVVRARAPRSTDQAAEGRRHRGRAERSAPAATPRRSRRGAPTR